MDQKSIYFESFLSVILVIKIIFIFSLVMKIIESKRGNSKKEEKYKMYEETFHNLFTLCMGILLIMLFSSRNKGEVCIDGHTKIYLFLFGVLSLLSIFKNYAHSK